MKKNRLQDCPEGIGSLSRLKRLELDGKYGGVAVNWPKNNLASSFAEINQSGRSYRNTHSLVAPKKAIMWLENMQRKSINIRLELSECYQHLSEPSMFGFSFFVVRI